MEVPWVPKKVPAIRAFPGSAEAICAIVINHIPGLAVLQSNDAIDLPTLQHLPPGLFAWDLIRQRECETVSNVKVAARIVGPWVQAVLRQVLIPVEGHVVQSMRVGVTSDEGKTVIVAAGEGNLQAVVIGT